MALCPVEEAAVARFRVEWEAPLRLEEEEGVERLAGVECLVEVVEECLAEWNQAVGCLEGEEFLVTVVVFQEEWVYLLVERCPVELGYPVGLGCPAVEGFRLEVGLLGAEARLPVKVARIQPTRERSHHAWK